MSVKSAVLALFEQSKELSVKEITDKLGVSKQMVHIVLNELVAARWVEKLGRTPKTVYRIIPKSNFKSPTDGLPEIEKAHSDFLKAHFLAVSESGELLEGLDAFSYWCVQRKLPLIKTIEEFIETKKKYKSYYNQDGTIDGMEKLRNTKGYDKIWLDNLIYLDFYAIERFGKTRLGTLLHYAKQGQNKFLMSIMLKEISGRVSSLVKKMKVDAVGFVPPTIRREIQFMKFLQSNLSIPLPVIQIKKLSGIIPVPQKSLAKLEERIRNARNSFSVTENRSFKHVLLIDDAVGSGSTLNQIAEKIKDKDIAKQVSGLAIVGSFKGFDVISDV